MFDFLESYYKMPSCCTLSGDHTLFDGLCKKILEKEKEKNILELTARKQNDIVL